MVALSWETEAPFGLGVYLQTWRRRSGPHSPSLGTAWTLCFLDGALQQATASRSYRLEAIHSHIFLHDGLYPPRSWSQINLFSLKLSTVSKSDEEVPNTESCCCHKTDHIVFRFLEVVGGMWRTLELWAREALTFCSQSSLGHSIARPYYW